MAAPVITLDGPSGSGKGAISRALAAELGWHFLDSGSLYRLLGWVALRDGVALDDEAALVALAGRLSHEHELPAPDSMAVMWDGRDVNKELRTEAAGEAASRVAVLPAVRTALLDWQRRYRQAPGLVADGRDMGTVVFPDADLKLYLTARPAVRAERRYKQLKEMGKDADLAALTRDIEIRDRRDSTRPTAPLKPAADAVVLDSSDIDEATTLARVLDLVRERL
ncbi:MAG: (d)CMP kinase [Thiohalobacterales bacterium]|nr:(d)CMP kinase [Thiohalobacterales bacterium]